MRHARSPTSGARPTAGLAAALAATVCLALGLGPKGQPARAAEPDQPKTVAVTVLGIHATNEKKPFIDPALKAIAAELPRQKFNSFRLVTKQTRDVPFGTSWEVPMPENYARRVRPIEATKDRVKVEVAWVQYVPDKQGRRRPKVRQRLVLVIGKGKYLLSGGWKLSKGALLGAVAVR